MTVASSQGITDKNITADLAIKTLAKALEANPDARGEVLLHSDRGSQFTSWSFVNFCKASGVVQSMSRSGCPHDNAVIERYFNTLKHDFMNLYEFKSERQLCEAVVHFVFKYNQTRPHSYNGNLTPNQKRLDNCA